MVEEINNILKINDSYKAPERLMSILLEKNEREEVFKQFLELFEYRMDRDWFHEYFQNEHADRKNKKQDFTPMSVSRLLTELAGESDGMYYEVAAGTGGICITKWNQDRLKYNPFTYKPSEHLYVLEELSDRALPFLIFNLAIRGINAAVVHCDALTRESYGVFFIQNDTDNPIGFSSINVMPYSQDAEEFFNVKFIKQKYEPHVESEMWPSYLT